MAITLAATDPANPYGALVDWPVWPATATRASRVAGARVVLVDGAAVAWIARGDRQLLVALPDDEPDRGRVARALMRELVRLAVTAHGERRGWLIAEVNGAPAIESVLKEAALDAGFDVTSGGLQLRVSRAAPAPTAAPADGAGEAGDA